MRSITSRTSFTSKKQDSADKWILGVAFVLGIVGSLALKVLGLPLWVPALFAGGIIVLYAISAHVIPAIQLESDQIGDNAYYLGFVLTLSSLSFTLYELGQHGGDADFIAYVIAGFGIALSSTIVGVAVRVICLQFRLDLVARDREARVALNDAMRRFRSELTDVIRGTKYLGVEIRQSLLEYHEDLAKAHKDAAKNLNADLVEAFKQSLDPLNGQLTSLTQQSLEDAKALVGATTEAREGTFRATVEGLKLATQSISDDLQKFTGVVRRTLEGAVADVGTAKEGIATQVGQTAQILEQQKVASEKLLAELGKVAVRAVDVASQSAVAAVSGAALQSKEGVADVTAASLWSLGEIRKSTDALAAQLQKQAEAIASIRLVMQQSEVQSLAATNDVLNQIKEASSSLAESQKLQLLVMEKLLEQHRSLSVSSAQPVDTAV
jgi:hypothetical protein